MRVEEPGCPPRQAPPRARRVEAFLVHRHRDDLRSELAEELERPVVRRLLDEHARVAAEALREEDEALEPAVRDEHALALDSVAFGDPVAERLVAARRAVREDRPPVGEERGARALGKLVDRQALGCGNPARKGDRRHVSSLGRVKAG